MKYDWKMKDYSRYVLWTDYFDSTLTRLDGRRVPLNLAVRKPTLKELVEAARRMGYNPEGFEAYHPKRSSIRSGYISIEKKGKKSDIIRSIGKTLRVIRGEQRQKEREVSKKSG